MWLAAGLHFGCGARSFVLLPLLSALVVLFFTDYDHQLLPDKVTLPTAAIGIALAPWNTLLDLAPGFLGQGSMVSRLASGAAGAVLGYGLFFTLAMVWQMLFARDAMGGGDLKMMLGVGAFLGIGGVVVTVFLASIVGTLLSLPYLLSGRWGMTRQLPFGCFLAPAAAITAFWGNPLIRWYLGLLMLS
ncbi:MAG: A24 family peptidase [Acidobacteriota bacterium]|nr:A24 family peptidase [Acidobacteriota bacterium]